MKKSKQNSNTQNKNCHYFDKCSLKCAFITPTFLISERIPSSSFNSSSISKSSKSFAFTFFYFDIYDFPLSSKSRNSPFENNYPYSL